MAATLFAATSLTNSGLIARDFVGDDAMTGLMADHQARYDAAHTAWMASPVGAPETVALCAVKNRVYAQALRAGVVVCQRA